MHLTEIYIYPVKSLVGHSLEKSQVTPLGLQNDRLMMLVDDNGLFISQRKDPQLALIKVTFNKQEITFNAPHLVDTKQQTIHLELKDFTHKKVPVEVWGDHCFGYEAPERVNQWFSDYLNKNVRLVNYSHETPRPSDPDFSKAGDIVSFADGFPLLLIGENSLNDLNARLEKPVTMQSFRPNIIANGIEAFAEDTWQQIKIGDVIFDLVKPCSRCVLTTVDPQTGIKRADGEPLRTLAKYRRAKGGVMFGMNLIPRNQGSISVKDKITVLK